jgi:hypothetical protein
MEGKGAAAGGVLSPTMAVITGVVGVLSLGDDLLSYEIGVADADEIGVSLEGSERDPGDGRPAAVREALNLDVFKRMLGGGSVSVWNGRDPPPCTSDELVD